MKNSSFFKLATAISALGLAFFTSCNPGSPASEKIAKADSGGATVPKSATTLAPITSDTLDVLYIPAQIFVDLTFNHASDTTKVKLTFRYFLTNPDSLTLHGWMNDSSSFQYPTPPSLKLFNGVKSEYRLGSGNYLGNLVIYKRGIRQLLRYILKNNPKYVVFLPLDPGANGGQIVYDVIPTNLDPHTLVTTDKTQFTFSGVQTNPSPPRTTN